MSKRKSEVVHDEKKAKRARVPSPRTLTSLPPDVYNLIFDNYLTASEQASVGATCKDLVRPVDRLAVWIAEIQHDLKVKPQAHLYRCPKTPHGPHLGIKHLDLTQCRIKQPLTCTSQLQTLKLFECSGLNEKFMTQTPFPRLRSMHLVFKRFGIHSAQVNGHRTNEGFDNMCIPNVTNLIIAFPVEDVPVDRWFRGLEMMTSLDVLLPHVRIDRLKTKMPSVKVLTLTNMKYLTNDALLAIDAPNLEELRLFGMSQITPATIRVFFIERNINVIVG
jgi:hypothetical protein